MFNKNNQPGHNFDNVHEKELAGGFPPEPVGIEVHRENKVYDINQQPIYFNENQGQYNTIGQINSAVILNNNHIKDFHNQQMINHNQIPQMNPHNVTNHNMIISLNQPLVKQGLYPTLDIGLAIAILIVNILFPGLGTMIMACFSNNPCHWLCVGLAQLLLSIVIVGWIWAIVTGVYAINYSREARTM